MTPEIMDLVVKAVFGILGLLGAEKSSLKI